MFPLWVVAVICLASTHGSSARALADVTCITDRWTFNGNNASPCQVGSELQSQCNGGNWDVTRLAPNAQYSGPNEGQSNARSFPTLSQWNFNCTPSDITMGQFPIKLKPGLSVPSWAYLNITAADVWDLSAALAVHNSGAPDTTSLPPASGTISPPANGTTSADLATGITTSPSATEAPSAPGSTTSTSTPGKKSNHAGPIAGGVVGGVIGLVLIGVGAFVLVRRHNTAASASSSDKEKFDLAATPSPFIEYAWLSFPMQNDSEPQKLYDPSDPSTFPRTPVFPTHVPPFATPDGVSTGYHPQNPLSLLPESGPSGRYTGVPEI
ncbi:hypothetical protein BU17DRAFT_94568 [Hysterangium stoloniferum]|nr:hypothetical protein BU17DRAFT_94568 [Hysterangium stoloniferum]